MQVKINFGKLKKRNLIIGKNEKMRPTQSRVKSVIFNLIDINSKTKVVDLFAGTGALGFESLSLGASEVIWSDNNYESVKSIKENIEKFNLDKNKFRVFKSDFRLTLKKLPFKADLIFIDPPFIDNNYWNEALDLIFNLDLLSDNGEIIIEKPLHLKISGLKKFKINENRRVGEKDIIILLKNNESNFS